MSALDELVARFRRRPTRLPSLLITAFGDAIIPRGGSVWLGTLQAMLRPLAIEEGAVRTALSRLTADGWIERQRIGRSSFYRLAARGESVFGAATEHIYNQRPPFWDGTFRFAILEPAAGRDGTRAALEGAGFGGPAPGLLIAPAAVRVPDGLDEAVILLDARVGAEDARRLAARAWPLGPLAAEYEAFSADVAPLSEPGVAASLTDGEALVARLLLIHAFRRVILRDPILPPDLLPPNWPGHAARSSCASLYARLLPASERWLTREGRGEAGPFPPTPPALRRRFTDVDVLQE